MPFILLVAGPNGAGKTTFGRQLAAQRPEATFVNADEAAQELPTDLAQPARNFRAGRVTLDRLKMLLEAGTDIILETTLAGHGYRNAILGWRARGYDVDLYYLRLPSVEVSLERIRQRVMAGGHDIPEEDARRRFGRSFEGFQAVLRLVNTWYLFDSLEGNFELVVAGENHGQKADRD
jgi:predicted ABC-type ATPase